jgi:hypothetical protein
MFGEMRHELVVDLGLDQRGEELSAVEDPALGQPLCKADDLIGAGLHSVHAHLRGTGEHSLNVVGGEPRPPWRFFSIPVHDGNCGRIGRAGSDCHLGWRFGWVDFDFCCLCHF